MRFSWVLLGFLVACGGNQAQTPPPAQVPQTPPEQTPPPAPPKAAQDEIDVALLEFNWKPEEIAKECERIEVVTDAKLVDIVAVAPEKRTFQSTFLAFEI